LQDMVSKKKPNPAIYLMAAEALGVQPKRWVELTADGSNVSCSNTNTHKLTLEIILLHDVPDLQKVENECNLKCLA